ncbi:unnamed protein product [Citrullus colocynthis]|uniref:Uncharacterized protein n=1 Tax=Citrullus colocynthis TaxID=252529 RepID=A0ABP0Y0W4_9ROSI
MDHPLDFPPSDSAYFRPNKSEENYGSSVGFSPIRFGLFPTKQVGRSIGSETIFLLPLLEMPLPPNPE